MCGICGIKGTERIEEASLLLMTDALKHRGPDAGGVFLTKNSLTGLGHRRLSILDLSDAANQPMKSADGRYVMVYNGEVYNYREIAHEIKIKYPEAAHFQTSSDTEVILKAFSIWGADMVHKLNGMFAIAIYDTKEEQLWLFRDRVGIKPIYYYLDQEVFAFASELKALTAWPQLKQKLTLNHEAISSFLHLGYVPEPMSIWKEIRKFPAGCWMRIGQNMQPEMNAYWQITDKLLPEKITDLITAKKQLEEIVNSAVEYRLVSDVPLGTFLSGGIDSSLVTAIASKLRGSKVNTFNIGFKEDRFDESQYARKVAAYLGTDHMEFILTEKEALPLVEEIVDTWDEPFADSSAISTMLVSKLARQYVTVILTGDGGDELFHGYGMYTWVERLDKPWARLLRQPVAAGLELTGNNRMQRAAKLFQYSQWNQVRSHIFSQEQYFFAHSELTNVLSNFSENEVFTYHDTWSDNIPLTESEKQALFDLQYYLKDDLLVKVDRASMKYSLECRVPLLDYRLVEFAINLHPKLKVRGNTTKYLLKELLYDYVPRSYFERPKWGFGVPMGKWLKNELHYLIDQYLSPECLQKTGVIQQMSVQKLLKDFHQGKYYLYNRIWQLILLQKWLLKNL